jgi:hypothetical protein
MQLISHGQFSSLKASFEIELGPFDFNNDHGRKWELPRHGRGSTANPQPPYLQTHTVNHHTLHRATTDNHHTPKSTTHCTEPPLIHHKPMLANPYPQTQATTNPHQQTHKIETHPSDPLQNRNPPSATDPRRQLLLKQKAKKKKKKK